MSLINLPNKKASYSSVDVAAIIYLTIPLLLFICGWLKIWISIPLVIMILFSLGIMINQSKSENITFIKEWSYRELLPSIGIFVTYAFLTGMTGNWAQHTDYYVRNDIFWDLTTKEWPPSLLDGRYFVYYFQTWLPASLIGSVTSWHCALWAYFAWSCLGICFVVYYLFKVLGKCSFWIACIFFTWNGLELLPCSLIAPILRNISVLEAFSTNEHVAGSFLTESPCFSMKNIIHCFIPLSIIGGMLLRPNIVKTAGPLLGILAVMYSPMSSIFLLPILTYLFFREHINKISDLAKWINWSNILKDFFSIINISFLVPFLLLIIPFYASTKSMLNWHFESILNFKNICLYIYYLIFNIGIAGFLILKKEKSKLTWIVLATHCICILSGMLFHHDVAMKGSVITTYFIIVLYCKSSINEKGKFKTAHIIYSIAGLQYFVHMTGALAATVVSIASWVLLRIKFRYIVSIAAFAITLFFLILLIKPTMFTPIHNKLSGKSVRYHKTMGIYQPDGGSGLWWWYQTFGNSKDMPIWFK